MDAQAQVYSSLHYRRVEVMGALVHKTEQYSKNPIICNFLCLVLMQYLRQRPRSI
jgi:hypothetical protein